MRLPWLEVASMVPLPAMANDVGEDIIEVEAFLDASSFSYNRVGEDIIEVEAFLDASSFSYNRVIVDAYHFFVLVSY